MISHSRLSAYTMLSLLLIGLTSFNSIHLFSLALASRKFSPFSFQVDFQKSMPSWQIIRVEKESLLVTPPQMYEKVARFK